MPPPGHRAPALHPAPRRFLAATSLAALLLAATNPLPAETVAGTELGLPFTRFYSYDEIGNVTRGVRLGFDPLGRIAVIRGGGCLVLNDTTWIDIVSREDSNPAMEYLVFGPGGEAYYSAFGTWGKAEIRQAKLRPRTLTPEETPKWVANANFNNIVHAATGVYFGSPSGVAYWERASGRHAFHALNSIARIFAIGETLYASTNSNGLNRLDPVAGGFAWLSDPSLRGVTVDQVTPYDDSRVLLSATDGRLFLFDGQAFTAFPGPLGRQVTGRISALLRLPEGRFAVAVNGAGLYLVDAGGNVLTALTTPEYHRVTDLAARETGVLWAVTETGVEKILYRSALTSFGQRQGLPVSWPQVVRWRGRIVVASGGKVYEAIHHGDTTRFQLMSDLPMQGVWAIATDGEHLLIGTGQAVYVREGGRFTPVLSDVDAARLVCVGNLFFVLGAAEIAALRHEDGRWTECAPRIPGAGYPHVVHASPHAAWLELGPGRAARVRHHDGRLHLRVFEDFPWQKSRWVNVGMAGDIVALTGLPEGRLYFNDRTEAFVERPELGKWLDQAPYPVNRFRQDGQGLIWATHDDGLLTMRIQDGRPVFDAATFGRINARFPHALLLPGDDIWLVAGQSLYHVNRQFETGARPGYQPTLVSLADGRTGRELLDRPGAIAALSRLTYQENSLVLRFFAGSYAGRHAPVYEYRLSRGSESRAVVGNGSLLTLSDLREGRYRLEARLTDGQTAVGGPLVVDFEIAPPWYRTWFAYLGCLAVGVALLHGLLRWSTLRTRQRNTELEQLVARRTEELRAAMERLNDETRQTATLAERNRLAGEIHDSVQQGLSGLMLHLDATLKRAGLPDDVRARLGIARNMVSFTRHEVQHAVWNMESPVIEDTELGEAIRKIVALIDPGQAEMGVVVEGTPMDLPSATKHHLLRIAQEAITNAVRHAAAHTIQVVLAYEPGGVVLRVTDDGNGFVPHAVLTGGIGHFGLRGLRARAEKIGGDLQIHSVPGQGTRVTIAVRSPLPVV